MHEIFLPLVNGGFTRVDSDSPEEVWNNRWHRQSGKGKPDYAKREIRTEEGRRKNLGIHQVIFPGYPVVNHRDGDGLNNLRTNLQPCLQKQNLQAFKRKAVGTSSKYRGVSWKEDSSKWEAGIQVENKTLYLGHFANEIDAARAYDAAAKKYFGDFAAPNFYE